MDQSAILTNPENDEAEPKGRSGVFPVFPTIEEQSDSSDIRSKPKILVDSDTKITVMPPVNDVKLGLADIVKIYTRRRTSLPLRAKQESLIKLNYDERDPISSYESLNIKPSDSSNQKINFEISQESDESKICDCTAYVFNPKEESYNWPAISEFCPVAVPALVKKYVECWKLNPVFKFHITSLETKRSTYNNLYGAEVIFSAPTPSCPNPQFNVSVYFKFEVSKVAPKTLPVRVSYHFEGQRQVHVADNRFTFQEGVLILLMKCKMKVFSELRF